MRYWLTVAVTGTLIAATVHEAAFGQIPDNMPRVLVGYVLSVAGLALVGVLYDQRNRKDSA